MKSELVGINQLTRDKKDIFIEKTENNRNAL